MRLIRAVASILMPPLGVFLCCGLRKRFWLNVVLTLFGYIPGVVHALWVVIRA